MPEDLGGLLTDQAQKGLWAPLADRGNGGLARYEIAERGRRRPGGRHGGPIHPGHHGMSRRILDECTDNAHGFVLTHRRDSGDSKTPERFFIRQASAGHGAPGDGRSRQTSFAARRDHGINGAVGGSIVTLAGPTEGSGHGREHDKCLQVMIACCAVKVNRPRSLGSQHGVETFARQIPDESIIEHSGGTENGPQAFDRGHELLHSPGIGNVTGTHLDVGTPGLDVSDELCHARAGVAAPRGQYHTCRTNAGQPSGKLCPKPGGATDHERRPGQARIAVGLKHCPRQAAHSQPVTVEEELVLAGERPTKNRP